MVNIQTRNAYSEIYNLLKIMNKKDVMQIPTDVLETIKENRNKEINPQVLNEESKVALSKQAISIYLFLYINYIEKDENIKNKLVDTLKKHENAKNEKFDIDIFPINKLQNHKETQLVEYKQNIFQRMIGFIKKFIKNNK